MVLYNRDELKKSQQTKKKKSKQKTKIICRNKLPDIRIAENIIT